ncbi:MAG: hypothetical protein AAB037_03655 [Chloroflexota bacterium]
MEWESVFRIIHLVTVVLMAAPFYALMVVGERALFSRNMIYQVDKYMEAVITKQAVRCYVFQVTVLGSGLTMALIIWPFSDIIGNWVLVVKASLLTLLIILLSIIHFGLQPRINRLLGQVSGDPIPPEIASQIRAVRVKRKRLAATCLFLVLAAVILALQVVSRFNLWVNVVFFVLAALFSWRVYKVPVRFGWV